MRWNKHLDKIATCDTSGTVIVWRNHNGRSIMELVNNRGTAISDFQWSNDGNKVLIAYVDGYVLVGTAYGRRIWARQLNLGSFVTNPNSSSQPSSLLSSTWSPDDSRIVVGSSIGELIELDAVSGGTLVSTTEVLPGIGIIGLQWVLVPKTAASSADIRGSTSPKDGQSSSLARGQIASSVMNQPLSGQQQQQQGDKSSNNVRLSLYLKNGKVVLMNSCGDQQATIIRTGLVDGRMLWSSDGAILAVAGFRKSQSMSTVRFFQPSGQLLFTLPLRTKVGLSPHLPVLLSFIFHVSRSISRFILITCIPKLIGVQSVHPLSIVYISGSTSNYKWRLSKALLCVPTLLACHCNLINTSQVTMQPL